MEENDISNVINKFSDILKEKDIKLDDYIDNSITNNDNDTDNNNNSNINSNQTNNKSTEGSGLNIDINTILKFKTIADKLNNSNNPRSSLLQALKPFLSSEKQGKIDEYIKIVNIISILDVLNKDLLG